MTKRIVALRSKEASMESEVEMSDGGIIYLECMKNHAAHIGGYAVDGCGEFMASTRSLERPEAELTCAACGCHRNYHRMEEVEEVEEDC
ncbi:hypothetical protein AAHA92_31845 [Salvia divinorum]|uniref:ZF-HD dimerization-type domain-containing protein n=1 Tax=Salvia divinorum TaxID=28513 RepID=A0ABD1FIR2_SALDI